MPLPDPGLVLHLPMREDAGPTAYDASRYGNDGSLGGGDSAKMPVWVEHGLRFDGVDDYVECPKGTNCITDDITVSALVCPKTYGARQQIYNIGNTPTDGAVLEFEYYTDKRFRFGRYSGAWDIVASDYHDPLQYYHVVATYTAGRQSIFVNGYEENHLTNTTSLTDPGGRKTIGINSRGILSPFDGSIDQLRIYNRALSAAEIKRAYKREVHNYV